MKVLFLVALFALSGCDYFDPNSKPIYGKESGLPVNCRAYVQASVNGFNAGIYTAKDAMAVLARPAAPCFSWWALPSPTPPHRRWLWP